MPAKTPKPAKPILKKHVALAREIVAANAKLEPSKVAKLIVATLKAFGYDLQPILDLIESLNLPAPTK